MSATPRRPWRPAVLLAAALAALAACSRTGPAAGAALPRVRFREDWYAQAEHGGFYQALARGFYREAGIDVEIVHRGGPGVRVSQLVLAGQVDIAMGRSDDIIAWVSRGLPFVIVGVYMEEDPEGILVHDESPVRTLADLDGRTVMGVPGSNWIDVIKARYHINFRLIPSNFGLAQFMADKDFIQQCFVTDEPYYVRKNGGHPRTLLISESGFRPYRVMYTTQRYVREHPAEVRAFVAASLRGWADFMDGDPAPGKALIARANPGMTEDFMDYSIRAMRDARIVSGRAEAGERLGAMSRRRLQEQVDDLFRLGIIPQLIPPDKFARFDLTPPDRQADAKGNAIGP